MLFVRMTISKAPAVFYTNEVAGEVLWKNLLDKPT